MDTANFTLTFGGFVVLIGLVIWWMVQRQVARNDDADKDWRKAQGDRVAALETELQELRLQLERKINREDLEKVYAAIEKVSSKFDQSTTEMIRLLTSLAASKTGGN